MSTSHPNSGPPTTCPSCGGSASTPCDACAEARLTRVAAEMESVKARIQHLDQERGSLQHRYAELLAEYQQRHKWLHEQRLAAAQAPGPPAQGAPPDVPPRSAAPAPAGDAEPGSAPRQPAREARPSAARRLREISTRSVQNLLLTLGGLLLAIAFVVFTVVSWGDLGLAGRAGVLGVLTALVGYVPRPLLRYDMRATAETVASLAALLLCLDAFALWTVGGTSAVPNPGFAAGALVAIAAVLAIYPAVLTYGLSAMPSAPRVGALLLAQPAPALAALALAPSLPPEFTTAPALLLTSAGNALLVAKVRAGYPRALPRFLGAAAWALGVVVGMLAFGTQLASASAPVPGWWTAAVLVLAGGVMLLDSRIRVSPAGQQAAAGAATAAWIAAAPATAAVLGAAQWIPPVWALSTLAAAVVLRLPAARTPGPTYTSAVSLGLVGWFGLPALSSLGDQLRWIAAPWEGPLGAPTAFAPDPAATVTLLATAAGATALAAARAMRIPGRRPDIIGPPALATGVLAAVLGAQWLPHPTTVAALVAATAALVAVATAVAAGPTGRNAREQTTPEWRARLCWTALALAGAPGALAISGALVTPAATVLTLAALLLTTSAAAWVPSMPGPLCRVVTGAAVLTATGLAVAACAALSAGWGVLMLAALAVAGLAVALAGWLVVAGNRDDQARTLVLAALAPMLTSWGMALPGGTHLLALGIALSSLIAALALSALLLLRQAQGVPPHIHREAARWPNAADVGLGQNQPKGAGMEQAGRLLGAVALTTGTAALLLVTDVLVRVVLAPLPLVRTPWSADASAAAPDLMAGAGSPLALLSYGVGVLALALLTAAARGRGAAAAVALAGGGLAVPLILALLAVPYSVVLTVLAGVALALLVVAGRFPGAPGYAAAGTGTVLFLLATAWSLAAPGRTVATLFALALGTGVAAAAASSPARRAPPLVSGGLAFLATATMGATVLAGYAALPHAGAATDPRWLPFLGLAAAGCASALCWLPWLTRRPEQRTGVGMAGTALVVGSLATALGTLGTLELVGLVTAVSALVLATLALVEDRRGAATVLALLTLVGAAASVLTRWVAVMVAPYGWLAAPWTGQDRPWVATGMLSPFGVSGTADPLLLPVLAFGAAATLLLAWNRSASREAARGRLAYAAAALAVPVLAPAAAAWDVNFGVALCWLLLVSASLLAGAAWARSGPLAVLCGGLALWPAVMALTWALATPATTIGTLLAVGLVAGSYPTLGRSVAVITGSTVAATLATGAFSVTLLLALGQPAAVAALALIAVIAGGAASVGAVRLARPVTLAIECSLAALAVVAVGLTLSDPERLHLTSVALAALGVAAVASAPRRDRGWLGPVGAVLLLAALWVLLGWLRVTDPEPYLAVPALAALALGWNWRRQHRAANTGEAPSPGTRAGPPRSWLAYGPGLALAMLPTLAMVLFADGGGPLRPALLAVTALAAILLGGWRRLQAPLFVGAAVLLVVGIHGSGGYLADLVLRIDRWVPVAVIGLVLLVIGARFERTLRDVRRLGRAIREMD
ncbi:hypothetical protein F4561_003874 [Lipingzhangella halophila]|uniref:Uncharacterized protein n=1 Tax=Lipingzhangella halophila TaxID=1783352 RepID=A0A7W7RJD1_9ACTN|nr:hypothetical protein [Lipingzhangella halophila]MBB4933054.1 hypothetical protein [Lipingzhangella halophila]